MNNHSLLIRKQTDCRSASVCNKQQTINEIHTTSYNLVLGNVFELLSTVRAAVHTPVRSIHTQVLHGVAHGSTAYEISAAAKNPLPPSQMITGSFTSITGACDSLHSASERCLLSACYTAKIKRGSAYGLDLDRSIGKRASDDGSSERSCSQQTKCSAFNKRGHR